MNLAQMEKFYTLNHLIGREVPLVSLPHKIIWLFLWPINNSNLGTDYFSSFED